MRAGGPEDGERVAVGDADDPGDERLGRHPAGHERQQRGQGETPESRPEGAREEGLGRR
jgi:hypothetical protein